MASSRVTSEIRRLSAPAEVGFTIVSATGQSADLMQLQGSTGTVLAKVDLSGNLYAPTLQSTTASKATLTTNGDTGGLLVNTGAAANKGLIVKGAASQSANLQEWQDSAGTILSRISSSGTAFVLGLRDTADGGAYLNMQTGTSGILINTRVASNKGLVVQATASQTANLIEFQNSSGTLLGRINGDGVPFFSTVRTTNSYIQAGENASGGYIRFDKATGNFSPGSGKAVLYFRDGTNAGTLKLVVIAGASGAETTILDNIPQT